MMTASRHAVVIIVMRLAEELGEEPQLGDLPEAMYEMWNTIFHEIFNPNGDGMSSTGVDKDTNVCITVESCHLDTVWFFF